MFSPEEEGVIDIDAALDTLVLKVSQDLINDIPAGDPRWIEMRVPGMLKDYCISWRTLHTFYMKNCAQKLGFHA